MFKHRCRPVMLHGGGDQKSPARIANALGRAPVAAAAMATALAVLLLPPLAPPTAAASVTVTAMAATTTTFISATAGAAANLPEDVLATALVSLGKGASLERLTAAADDGQPPPNPALYVTARVGQRGRVLASVRVPLVRV
jgi:hypothetical protein